MPNIEQLEQQLNDFDIEVRKQALKALTDQAASGDRAVVPEQEVANMHCHTFFSYNGYGYSPSALAWLAKSRGYKLMGIVDFDVLDAVDEFLGACDQAEVRASAGMETRVYVPEFADREINSPGEPGIYYYMGIGFTSSAVPEGHPDAQYILADMRLRADRRNRDLIRRVNAYLAPMGVDYDRDVLPLTPSGNATERHICEAYVEASKVQCDDPAVFWAEKLGSTPEAVVAIMDNAPKIQGLVRSKLMKRGGVGYQQPGPRTFPSVEEVNKVITACGALPCATWLDGTTAGEQAEEDLLKLLISKGAVALNIVPDRNWNIADPDVKARKVAELYKVVALAQKLDLPINIGTEMNAYGTPLIDDFDAPELAPVKQAFLDGAYFIYGHTMLQRALKLGYQSEWAQKYFPTRRDRNAFYMRMGRILPPGIKTLNVLRNLRETLLPETLLNL